MKHRDIKLVTTQERRNYLVSELNYFQQTFFSESLLAIEIKMTRILMNKLFYLVLSILEISKIVMYEFSFDCIKSKFTEKVKLCYKLQTTLYFT